MKRASSKICAGDAARAKKIHEALLQARLASSNELRPELEAALFDLSSVSRKLSDVMLSRAAGKD